MRRLLVLCFWLAAWSIAWLFGRDYGPIERYLFGNGYFAEWGLYTDIPEAVRILLLLLIPALPVAGGWLVLRWLKLRRRARRFNGWPNPGLELLLIALLLSVGGAPAMAGERINLEILGLKTLGQFAPFGPPEAWNAARWGSPYDRPIYIREARVWVGFDQFGVADINTQLVRESDGSVLVFMPFDHYAEPSQPIIERVSFVPDYVVLQPGDALILRQAAVQWVGIVPQNAAAAAWISFTLEKP